MRASDNEDVFFCDTDNDLVGTALVNSGWTFVPFNELSFRGIRLLPATTEGCHRVYCYRGDVAKAAIVRVIN